MSKVKSKQLKITLTEEDFERFQKLSENTELSKSILTRLMLGGTLRDLKNYKKSSVSYLISAWSSKKYEDMIQGIDIY